MRIKAYILAADPAFVKESLTSIYDAVEEVIVSYDVNSIGYTGMPVDVNTCLALLRSVDREGKLRYCPGNYARLEHEPMENETHQRRCALREASQDADWVLQLDTDEVALDPAMLVQCIKRADAQGFQALDYPARWFYRQVAKDKYLEACTRFWGIMAGYPGAMAVRANTYLRCARQCDAPIYRVDFRPINTDPWRSRSTTVHQVIRDDQGIIHFSMVRTEAQMQKKIETWSHSKDRNWTPQVKHWRWSGRFPYLAMLMSPLLKVPSSHPYRRPLRVTQLDAPRSS